MFTPEIIDARVRKQPFMPLHIVTSSGESYEVQHPDLIMIGRRDLIIGLASKKNPKHYEEVARVAIMHVTALEDLLLPSNPASDGQ